MPDLECVERGFHCRICVMVVVVVHNELARRYSTVFNFSLVSLVELKGLNILTKRPTCKY